MARTRSGIGAGLVRLVVGPAVTATWMLAGPGAAAAADRMVFSNALASGWQNWSWQSTVRLGAGGGMGGSRAIAWQVTGAWGALFFHTDVAVPTDGGSALRFALRPSRANQQLWLVLFGDDGERVGTPRRLSELGGDPPANRWKVYTVPLGSLGAAGARITGVAWQDATGGPQPTIRVDQIVLTGVDPGGAPASPSPDPPPARPAPPPAAPAPPPPPAPAAAGCPGGGDHPEIRQENVAQNLTRGRPTDPSRFFGHAGWRPYYDRIDGACTGTTEEILEWAARKWGFDQLGYPDLAKAMGVVETWWRQAFVGANGEVGILQVHPGFWPDPEPAVWSTAYAADYAMAAVRSFYDGASWLGDSTRGNLRDAVAAWNCGCPSNGWGDYATWVFRYHDTKPWQRPGQPPEWF